MLGHGLKQGIDRGPVTVQLVAAAQAAAKLLAAENFQMRLAAGRQIDIAGLQRQAVAGLTNLRGAKPVEPVGESGGEMFRHVLGDDDRRAIGRQPADNADQGLDAAGRGSDGDDFVARPIIRRRGAGRRRRAMAIGGPRLDAHLRRYFDLVRQFIEAVLVAGVRLHHAIDGADLQRLDRRFGSPGGEGRDHDHRHRPEPHDLVEKLDSAHVRHLDVEGEYIGIELLDRLARLGGVRRRADHLDGGIALQRGGDQALHGGRIVDDQDAHGAHAVSPARSR